MRWLFALFFPAIVLALMLLAVVAGVPFEYAGAALLLLAALTVGFAIVRLIVTASADWHFDRRNLIEQRRGFEVIPRQRP